MLKQYMTKINGKNFEYYEGGTGTDLVFLHGFASDPKAYKDTLDLLAQNFTVIAPSIPGHGNSENTDDLNLNQISESLLNFIKKKKLNNFILVGHSMGGLLSTYVAVKIKSKVNCLILIDSAGLNEHNPIYRYFLISFLLPLLTIGTTFKKNAGKRYVRLVNYGTEYLKRGIKCLRNKHILNFIKELVLIDHKKIFKKVNCKTLILWGSWDKFISVNDAWEINKLIKNSKVIILNKYFHGWCCIDSERLAKEVKDFVNNYKN